MKGLEQSMALSWDEFHLNPSTSKKGQLRAFCSSAPCQKSVRKDTAFSLGTEIKVSSNVDFCPNCGSALFWSRHEGSYKKGSFKGITNPKKSRRWK